MRQSALTVVAEVSRGKEVALAALLEREDAGDELGFGNTTTVHFGRLVLLSPKKGDGGPTRLALETNYDGDAEAHLDDLLTHTRVTEALACCDGFAAGPCTLVKAWLRRHTLPEQTFYVGTLGFTLAQVRQNRAIRVALSDAVDRRRKEPSFFDDAEKAVATLRADVQRAVQGSIEPDEPEGPEWVRITAEVAFVLVPIALLLLLSFGWVPLLAILRKKETTDPVERVDIDDPDADGKMDALTDTEDWLPQNPLSVLSTVKPGAFRWLLVRATLYLVHRRGRYQFPKGHLGEMWAIHFARWVLLDDGRLLFFSNYDGSWESYLGDFVDKASTGLTAVWSNTKNYPRTKYLAFGGATDEEAFKAWTRGDQIPTQFWYTAYPDLSVRNIWNDHALVKLLAAKDGRGLPELLRSLP